MSAKDTEVETGAPVDKRVSETTQVDSFSLDHRNNNNTGSSKGLKIAVGVLAAATIGLLVSTIYLAVDRNNLKDKQASVDRAKVEGPNPCQDQKPDLPNVACVIDQVEQTGEQSGVNVTKGYQGSRNTTAVPITSSYFEAGLCPVNVHWHLGAEHYSVGEFDETGTAPNDFHEGRHGFKCSYYDENDPRFTTKYNWEHCIGMLVGQTYEVHWPHSAAGACGTPFQYQTPFYDGVFCRDGVITDTAAQIGVQAQVFTIINDEEYFYPNLFGGMIVDGEKGTDIAKYTGSTTGTARNNEICSPFTPITWQVDRKCHLISASSFDEMCREMKMQADNMNDDLYAHGSRELVDDEHAANNQQLRKLGIRRSN
jgi:hypothetical protein